MSYVYIMMAMTETKKATIVARLVLTLALAAQMTWASDWSRFRGSNGAGVADTTGLPAEFGPEKNVIWKTALPPGPSSPILSDDRIFLTAYEEQKLWTLCLDRRTGKVLWRREAPRDREEKIDDRNSPASPSPATDGKSVYAFFPDYGLVAYDFQGKEMWGYPLGPFNNTYGMGASPILADDKVLLVCDQQTDSFVIALGKSDGRLHWKVDRPEAKSGHSTPILYHPEKGATQLIVPGSFLLTAYSVDSGEKVWWVSGLSFEMKSTPVLHQGTIYINGYGAPFNQPGKHIKIDLFQVAQQRFDADGDGRFSKEEVVRKNEIHVRLRRSRGRWFSGLR